MQQFLPRATTLRPISRKFRLGADVWDVWIYKVDSEIGAWPGSPSSSALASWERIAANSAVIGWMSMTSEHQEYVAFRNGLLEDWGWGTLPLAIRNDAAAVEVRAN
ncbi:MAG: hypothetical protein QOC81_3859 [Thermoanaerobaculia bacterium]|nr:hypothetical protein [Thermoanaerobaculia bacterium]